MSSRDEVLSFLMEQGIDFEVINNCWSYGVIAIKGEVFEEVLPQLVQRFPVEYDCNNNLGLYISFESLKKERGN
jgi:hypothetical protein